MAKSGPIDRQFPHWVRGLTAQITVFVIFLSLLALTAAAFGLLGRG